MNKYKYIGSEDKVYYDPSGNRFPLKKGDVIEVKVKPDWEDIVEHSEVKEDKKTRLKENDGGK